MAVPLKDLRERQRRYESVSLAQIQTDLGSGIGGISEGEAALRLVRYGPNVIDPHRRRTLLIQFLAYFLNPLILLLLAASAVSAMTGDVTSFLLITLVVFMSVLLDFLQEHRAERAAEALKHSVQLRSKVIRGGKSLDISAREIVPGDVVVLSAGDLIPADGRIIEAKDFFINQALLTGEPYPIEKRVVAEAMEQEASEGTGGGTVFLGASVVSGSARMLVAETGTRTALGEIAESLASQAPPTSFDIGTRNFGLMIMRLTILLALFALLVNAYFARPWLESFLFATALAVGLAPELLPMVVSVTLARGALRMAKRKVIIKRLAAIENLGSMDVLCTDKTGTLTEARIRLERHVDARGENSQRVLELAYLNSFFETGLRSPLDDAILQHGEINVTEWRKIDEVPFDFERRRVSVLVEHEGGRLLAVKGAPEDVLRLSTQFEGEGPNNLRPLDASARLQINRTSDELAREGFRVLGIASRVVPAEHGHAVVGDETELVFAGFAAFLDPPKTSAAPSLKNLLRSGIVVKIVTGDNELVTQHVCRELEIGITGVLTGDEIARMDDQALGARAESVNLFCRVNPSQKNRIILALKRNGHTVGYLGDGINDAPSLHSADVSISVDGAVDVAKEAAELILLEPDLGVLGDAVLEGRRTFGNIMKYIMMATSSNFGNMFSMAGASLILPFLPMLPVQILLNNFLYDLSEIPIPMDEVDPEDLLRPRKWDMRFIRNFMLVVGPVSSLFDFLTFYLMLHVLHATEALFQTGWFIESMATQILVIFIIRTRRNPLASRPNTILAISSVATVALSVLIPFTPFGKYLGFVPPPMTFFLALAGMVVAYLVFVEIIKRWFYAHLAPRV